MESGGNSTTPQLQPQELLSVPQQPKTLDQEAKLIPKIMITPATRESRGNSTTPLLQPQEPLDALTLRSQLFLQTPRIFRPFHQTTPPPLAEEWLHHLTNAPTPPTGNPNGWGTMQLDWGTQTKSRGACPMLHTIFHEGKAQSAWDPMPAPMLKSYLETLATISYGFTDIVEEYLPGRLRPHSDGKLVPLVSKTDHHHGVRVRRIEDLEGFAPGWGMVRRGVGVVLRRGRLR